MKVPVLATINNDQLFIYRNKNIELTPLPFKPFILCQEDKFPQFPGAPVIQYTKVPEYEEKNYLKLEFSSLQDQNEFKKQYVNHRNYMLCNTYLEQLFIYEESFFFKYPNTEDLTVMFYDIEVASKGDGLFPKPLHNEILCIGFSIWKYKNDGSKVKIHHEICKGFNPDTNSDLDVCTNFLGAIQEWDPDIIAGYYSSDFDLPYIIARCEINKLDLGLMGRNGKPPKTNKDEIYIPGRIHFDIYSSNAGVIKDQTLFGIKSKSLKDLSRWYKIKKTIFDGEKWIQEPMEDIELPEHIADLLKLFKTDVNRLYAYLDDDIYRTEGVGHIYIRNCITLAEMIGLPLNNIMNMYSSLVPKLFLARNMEKEKIINTETNFQKYNLKNGSIAKLGSKYEGAIVGLFKRGFFNEIFKIDFTSQYPSSVQTFNLGPDTTKLLKVLPYTGKYSFERQGNVDIYNIPTKFEDGKFAYNLVIQVKNDKEGFLKREIKRLREERVKIKKELKAAKTEDEKAALNSQQTAIKIILNSIYGALGLKTTIYGDMISAVMVTAMCRWCSLNIMQRNKDVLVEVDTDGLILEEARDPNIENKWLEEKLKKRFMITDNYMSLEADHDSQRAYFYAMKNYVIENKPGDYTKHGSSIKSSRVSYVIDRAIDLAIEHVFNNKPAEEVIREAFDIRNLPLDNFSERMTLNKELSEYDDPTDHHIYLAKQVELRTGQIVTEGTQISYVITKDPLPYKEFKEFQKGGRNYAYINLIKNTKELDFKYYEDQIEKALLKFGIKKYVQMDLFGNENEADLEPLDVVPMDEI